MASAWLSQCNWPRCTRRGFAKHDMKCCTVHQKSTAMLHTAFFRCASVDGLCLPLSTCGSTADDWGSVDPRAGSVGPAGPSHSRGQMWQQLLGDVFHALAQSPSLPWAPLGPGRRVIANGASSSHRSPTLHGLAVARNSWTMVAIATWKPSRINCAVHNPNIQVLPVHTLLRLKRSSA